MGDTNPKDKDYERQVTVKSKEPMSTPIVMMSRDESLDESKFNMGVASVPEIVAIRDGILPSNSIGESGLYEDRDFPAAASSLWFNTSPPNLLWKDVEWKRISELSSNPTIVKDGVTRDDVMQGMLADCWWLSACAAVARQPKLFAKVIPSGQPTTAPAYTGMFHFRFWRFGTWVDVIIDDRIPTLYGRPVFARSKDDDEFWPSLLEKAYAKLHGSYEAIQGGFATDALEDLTGGMAITFELDDKTPGEAFKMLQKSVEKGSFACCSIAGSSERVDEETGLVSSHAYTVTGAGKVRYKGENVELVRVRNPWGNKVEWTGAWSDGSPVWNEVDDEQKETLGYADRDNGEWWMSFDDFKLHFFNVTLCTLGPDFDGDGAPTGDRWMHSTVRGKWEKGSTAGGSSRYAEKYAKNPQFYMNLKESDDFNPLRDEPKEEGKCSIVIGLMQEYRRAGKAEGLENLYLGLAVYKVDEKPSSRLDEEYFWSHESTASPRHYLQLRETSLTIQLSPGHYVIIPSTLYPDESGSFLIRVYTEKDIELVEL